MKKHSNIIPENVYSISYATDEIPTKCPKCGETLKEYHNKYSYGKMEKYKRCRNCLTCVQIVEN